MSKDNVPVEEKDVSGATPMDVENDEMCWICLDDSKVNQALVSPCKCPRKVHPKCLARWQLQQAGRAEETQCRFCNSKLRDWKETMTPDALKPEVEKVQPIMVVYFEGEIHRIPVRQGDEGLKEFTTRIRELFKLPPEVDISLTFGCKEPMSGHHLKLEGMGAFDAAVHCASVAAAERQHKQIRKAQGLCKDGELSDDGEDTTDLLQSTLGGPIQPPRNRTQSSTPQAPGTPQQATRTTTARSVPNPTTTNTASQTQQTGTITTNVSNTQRRGSNTNNGISRPNTATALQQNRNDARRQTDPNEQARTRPGASNLNPNAVPFNPEGPAHLPSTPTRSLDPAAPGTPADEWPPLTAATAPPPRPNRVGTRSRAAGELISALNNMHNNRLGTASSAGPAAASSTSSGDNKPATPSSTSITNSPLNYDVPPNAISRSKLNQVLSFFGIKPPQQYTLGSSVTMDE